MWSSKKHGLEGIVPEFVPWDKEKDKEKESDIRVRFSSKLLVRDHKSLIAREINIACANKMSVFEPTCKCIIILLVCTL